MLIGTMVSGNCGRPRTRWRTAFGFSWEKLEVRLLGYTEQFLGYTGWLLGYTTRLLGYTERLLGYDFIGHAL